MSKDRVSLGFVVLIAGCAPTCVPGPSATAPPEGTAAAVAEAGPAKCGIDGQWCTFDVPRPHSTFQAAEVLSLPKALWGVDAPNLLKSLSVAWDGRAGRLYAIGIATDRLASIDPAVGRPTGAIDLDVRGHNSAIVRVDEARRRLWRLDKGDGAIRVVDLDTGEVVARSKGTPMARTGEGRGYPIHDAEIDPATGWLWVANRAGGALTGWSPDLAQTKLATGIGAPASLDVRADEILVVDAPTPQSARVLRYKPSTDAIVSDLALPRAAGPTNAQFTPDGAILLGGRMLALLGDDGAPRWTAPLGGMSEAVAFVGDTVAVLIGDEVDHGRVETRGAGGERGRGRSERPPLEGEADDAPERRVRLFDVATGAPKGEVTVGYEAKSVAVDAAGKRLFVANGGDASVTIVDVPGAKVAGTIDVGAAAEHVLVDPARGDRYVVDRLGGSTIYRWPKGAETVEAWPAGRWPSDAVIDGGKRRLWALGHYDAALLGWDLDAKAPVAPIDLGLPSNRSDTLGDLDYDPAVGLAAVVFPESGGLAVVDPASGKVLWRRVDETLAAGAKAGPGHAFVAVDGERDRLYVVAGHGARVIALGLRDGAEKGEIALEALRREEIYNVNGAWLDRAAGKLYVGPRIVEVPTLVDAGRIDGVGKVFWGEGGTLLGLGPGSGREPEQLVEIDAASRSIRASWPLVPTGMMRLNPTYDPVGKRVYVADMAEARVLAYDWPRK